MKDKFFSNLINNLINGFSEDIIIVEDLSDLQLKKLKDIIKENSETNPEFFKPKNILLYTVSENIIEFLKPYQDSIKSVTYFDVYENQDFNTAYLESQKFCPTLFGIRPDAIDSEVAEAMSIRKQAPDEPLFKFFSIKNAEIRETQVFAKQDNIADKSLNLLLEAVMEADNPHIINLLAFDCFDFARRFRKIDKNGQEIKEDQVSENDQVTEVFDSSYKLTTEKVSQIFSKYQDIKIIQDFNNGAIAIRAVKDTKDSHVKSSMFINVFINDDAINFNLIHLYNYLESKSHIPQILDSEFIIDTNNYDTSRFVQPICDVIKPKKLLISDVSTESELSEAVIAIFAEKIINSNTAEKLTEIRLNNFINFSHFNKLIDTAVHTPNNVEYIAISPLPFKCDDAKNLFEILTKNPKNENSKLKKLMLVYNDSKEKLFNVDFLNEIFSKGQIVINSLGFEFRAKNIIEALFTESHLLKFLECIKQFQPQMTNFATSINSITEEGIEKLVQIVNSNEFKLKSLNICVTDHNLIEYKDDVRTVDDAFKLALSVDSIDATNSLLFFNQQKTAKGQQLFNNIKVLIESKNSSKIKQEKDIGDIIKNLNLDNNIKVSLIKAETSNNILGEGLKDYLREHISEVDHMLDKAPEFAGNLELSNEVHELLGIY